jgi:glycosyltransferase involved in cell wall biosynthesis
MPEKEQFLPISVTVLTKNSASYIRPCLESLKYFAEVVILDNGSNDNIAELAAEYKNTVVYKCEFIGFGPLKNLAAEKARFDWIFTVDSDERLSPALIQELRSLQLSRGTVYALNRHNYFNGRHIRACGWDNDVVTRVYNRLDTSYSSELVHEAIIDRDLQKVILHSELIHCPMRGVSDFIDKMQLYSSLFAEKNRFKRHMGAWLSIGKGLAFFLRDYFLKRGFLYGYEGFLIAISNANGVLYKCLKLKEANERLAVSLIVNVDNLTDNILSVFLASVRNQSYLPAELILAGLETEPCEAVKRLLVEDFPMPVKYVCRNSGRPLVSDYRELAEWADGEYLVFLRGSYFLPRNFVKEQLLSAWKGFFVQSPIFPVKVGSLHKCASGRWFSVDRWRFFFRRLFRSESDADFVNYGLWREDILNLPEIAGTEKQGIAELISRLSVAGLKCRKTFLKGFCLSSQGRVS